MKKRNIAQPQSHKFKPFDFLPNADTDAAVILGNTIETKYIQEFIHRRRRQMIIHSVIYYRLDDNIVDDHTWQEWANQLAVVQNRHPSLKDIGFHDDLFADWDGTTGNHLCLVEYYSQAQSILATHRKHYGLAVL